MNTEKKATPLLPKADGKGGVMIFDIDASGAKELLVVLPAVETHEEINVVTFLCGSAKT